MALKPWYKVVTPREDLRDNRPLDASEFAVHLDHVRDNRAPADYQEPRRFFERTFLTKNLTELAAGVVRRLSGIKLETLGNHFKSGQRLSLQNRPTEGTRNLDVLSCHTLFRQV